MTPPPMSSDAPDFRAPCEAAPGSSVIDTRRKVLVADDDAAVRGMITEFLTARGCDVLQAGSGLEALLQVKRQAPQVVVLDVQMPRLGGLEAIPRIRAFDPSTVIVVITGEADGRLHEQARQRGASAVLVKPIALPELAAAVAAPKRTAGEMPEAAELPAAPSSAAPSREILIVDDDPEVSDALRDLLSMKGYQTRVVADAPSALREVIANPPAVILLDINMPGLSGLNALPAIHQLAPRTLVMLMSGVMDDDTFKRARTYGAFDFFTKPIDIDDLAHSIETAFGLRALDS